MMAAAFPSALTLYCWTTTVGILESPSVFPCADCTTTTTQTHTHPGDTRPCQAVIDAARGATLLVHEATFEDELAADAIAKKHSTLSEALGVAAAAGVYRVVLTHFSGRYPKMQLLTNNSNGSSSGGEEGVTAQPNGSAAAAAGQPDLSRAIIGFDLMTLCSQDLGWLPLLRPLVDELCRDEEGVTTGGEDTAGDE
jgi:ribonuclease Z